MKDIKIKEKKDNIIKEIEDLKIKLDILQQKYDKIKAMFE